MEENRIEIDMDLCTGCGLCIGVCPTGTGRSRNVDASGVQVDRKPRSAASLHPRLVAEIAARFFRSRGSDLDVPAAWQQMACSMLKMAYLIKSVEEDSQDINDSAQLGFFLSSANVQMRSNVLIDNCYHS